MNRSALDPEAPCHSIVGQCLNSLASEFTHYFNNEEMEGIAMTIKKTILHEKGGGI